MRRMLGGSSGVPPGWLAQTPFVQVPLQGWLQAPQFCASDMTSTQAFPHSIWPDAEQPQTPPLQTDPAGHCVPQAPQFSALFIRFTHAPSPHIVSPVAHIAWQELPLQTCPDAQVDEQPPQWVASGGTQVPPQASRPAVHRHWPAWQLSPAPQALPQAPQFC
jgi:hypothetical protein